MACRKLQRRRRTLSFSVSSRGAFHGPGRWRVWVAIDGVLKAGSPIGVSELFEALTGRANEETIWRLKEIEASGDTSKLTEQERWLLQILPAGECEGDRRMGYRRIRLASRPENIQGHQPFSVRLSADGITASLFRNGYHALAIDEHRPDFAPTLWDVPSSERFRTRVIAQPRPMSGAEQRWFVGAMPNVGGGYENRPSESGAVNAG